MSEPKQQDRPDQQTAQDVDDDQNGQSQSDKKFVIGVILETGGSINYYYWNNIELKVGDLCIVQEDKYFEFGTVAISRFLLSGKCCRARPSGKIIRMANDKDIDRSIGNGRKEKAAMAYCRDRIYERNLSMSLSKVHYTLDSRKAFFYYTADNRVDFRALVKDLCNHTRVKVEMRQVGVRDEARMLGGCGPCGQELCCSKFLNDFSPVTIRMAKDQGLSLSPEKISGVCGRLMCCLSFEHATYKQALKGAPKMGKAVVTNDDRCGKVCQLNALKETVVVAFEDGSRTEYQLSEVKRANQQTSGARWPDNGPGQNKPSTSASNGGDRQDNAAMDTTNAEPKTAADKPARKENLQNNGRKSVVRDKPGERRPIKKHRRPPRSGRRKIDQEEKGNE